MMALQAVYSLDALSPVENGEIVGCSTSLVSSKMVLVAGREAEEKQWPIRFSCA
jgi:hypothetical protein